MNPFEYAKKMELDGKALYEEELSKTANPGLKSILKMLISQEQRHCQLFDYMEKSSDINFSKASFAGIKNLFEKMRETSKTLPKDPKSMYKRIQGIEKESEEFYRKMAKKQKDAKVKEQILEIANEEHQHFIIIGNIIEMIEKPDKWVDSAEINHMEDY